MAATITILAQGTQSTAGDLTTVSVSPASNSHLVLLAGYFGDGTTDPAAATPGGLSLDWDVVIGDPGIPIANRCLHAYQAPAGSSPGTGALTIEVDPGFGAEPQNWVYAVVQITNFDTTPIVEFGTNFDFGVTSLGATIPGTAGTNDVTMAVMLSDEVTAGQSPEGGWSQVASQTTADVNLSVITDAELDQTPSWSWTNPRPSAIIAFTVEGVAGGGGAATAATDVGLLTADGFAPTILTPVTITVDVGSGTFTGFAPVISTSVGNVITQIPVGTGTFTGLAPTPVLGVRATTILTQSFVAENVTVETIVEVGAGAGTFTGFAPDVGGAPTALIPDVGLLVFTGLAPTIVANALTVVGVATGTFTGFAPTFATTTNDNSPATGGGPTYTRAPFGGFGWNRG